ncbi:MAG: T9SS type A sorting domain-containing protein [Bacteroidales bacterium]|nr:T9SS type A sorting domain-containing protein [Bacteroidales bacterium]
MFFGLTVPLSIQRTRNVRSLEGNEIIRKLVKEEGHRILKSTSAFIQGDSLFDDFSDITFFPNHNIWQDNYAFINNTFAVEPISYGVATLDAIDEYGDVYNLSETKNVCDYLTSLPLNLVPGLKYHLSFYQPQGLGEAPEETDSLVVEFSTGISWIKVWSTTGTTVHGFTQVIIEVPDSLTFDGFMFRFRNTATFSSKDLKGGKGALGNFDVWHIDYVRFNSKSIEDHQVVADPSIINNPAPSLKTYTSIPWSHIDEARFVDLNEIMPIALRINNVPRFSLDTVRNFYRFIYVKDLKTGEILYNTSEAGENFQFDSIYWRYDFYRPIFNYDNTDTGKIEVGVYINPEKDNYKGKRHGKTDRKFTANYYAFDDGTPELGFGLSGESVNGSLLVQRFNLFKPDTLRAIDIYFNKTKDHFTADKPFQLCVWDYDPEGKKPRSLLYPSPDNMDEAEYYFPDTLVEFNFKRYRLGRPIAVSDIVYVGIIQRSNEFMNIGYDLNNAHRDRIFYNTTGDWVSNPASIPNGSLMIRPVMSEKELVSGIKNNNITSFGSLQVYPNPTDHILNFGYEGMVDNWKQARIYNLVGNTIISEYTDKNYIEVSSLSPGIYIIHITTESGNIYTGKFSVTR